jgi:hypothetical protein
MSKDPKKAARLLRASFGGLLTLALPYQFASAGGPASGLGAGSPQARRSQIRLPRLLWSRAQDDLQYGENAYDQRVG